MNAVIIGYGGMGGWHYEAIKEVGNLNVVGIYDVRTQVFEKARNQNLAIFASFEEILDNKEIKIVIVATPNDSHKDYIIRSLRAGKHVVCEKPVTLSTKDLRDIIAVQEEVGTIFTIHQNRRWDTDFRTVQKIVKEKLIGQPYFIESRVNGSSVFLHGWRDFKMNGGGMLYDWGVHLIDQVLQLNDSPVISVTAHVKNVFSEEVDDNVKLLLEFVDGLSVILEVATNCFIPFPRWHLSGKAGTAIIENWQCDGKIIQLVDGTEPTWSNEIVYTAAGPTRTMAPRPKTTLQELPLPVIESEIPEEFNSNYYSAYVFYHNLIEAIDGKAELLVTPTEALRVLEVIEIAFESASVRHGLTCNI